MTDTVPATSTSPLIKREYIDNKSPFVTWLYNFAIFEINFFLAGIGIISIVSSVLLGVHGTLGIKGGDAMCTLITTPLVVFSIVGFTCLISLCIGYRREIDSENRKYTLSMYRNSYFC